MENCDVTIDDDLRLTIAIDLKTETGFTKSGQSVCVGGTGGNLDLWHNGQALGIKLNVNCFRKITNEERAKGQVKLKGWDDK